jgi:hypothetical protein
MDRYASSGVINAFRFFDFVSYDETKHRNGSSESIVFSVFLRLTPAYSRWSTTVSSLIDLELGSRSIFNIRQVTIEDNGKVHVLVPEGVYCV